uniref:Uncharacterized protein n=1 Tax=Leersia perrieri TaxID=77586 RepID=A0A0D9X425_9ORYZ
MSLQIKDPEFDVAHPIKINGTMLTRDQQDYTCEIGTMPNASSPPEDTLNFDMAISRHLL